MKFGWVDDIIGVFRVIGVEFVNLIVILVNSLFDSFLMGI